VLKKVQDAKNAAGKTGKSEIGEDGQEISHKKIMGHKEHKTFPLKVSLPKQKSVNDADSNILEDDYYTEFSPMNDDGITPLSKLNGTSVTIADVLLHDEKILVGDATFTKKCDSMQHCFVAKCVHAEFDDSRRRFCTIYKNLHLPGTELLNSNQENKFMGATWVHAASSATMAAALLYIC